MFSPISEEFLNLKITIAKAIKTIAPASYSNISGFRDFPCKIINLASALARFIILQGKSLNPEILLYEAGAIVLIALAIVILRFRNSSLIGLNKKK